MDKRSVFLVIVLAGLVACAFEVGQGVREADEFERARAERIARFNAQLDRLEMRQRELDGIEAGQPAKKGEE